MNIVIGTAGHIDHGKTAVVKALTGVDADRLPEEKDRGITIDLGFAEMQTGDVRIGFVDVPGHERFVKNMLAGASGIDVVMLVVAADEGVMPQTREHFDICRLLRIRRGVVALTKSDLVDEETLELAKLDVAELVSGSFLEDAPVFPVSARTGTGVDELKLGLARTAGELTREVDIHEARLPIDRSFSVKGFGAVVTGTLAYGSVTEGMELELLPDGRRVRIRGIQTHGKTVTTAHAGQRTAINLAGIGHDEISRGMILAAPDSLVVTQSVDAEVEMLPDAPRGLTSRQRVRLHLGTAEILARVVVLHETREIAPGRTGLVQFRLETPAAAAHGDRFIIRSYSPQRTIGGGRVLDPAATRHRRSELERISTDLHRLSGAADGDGNVAVTFASMVGTRGISAAGLRSRTALRPDVLKHLMDAAVRDEKVVDADGVLIARDEFARLRSSTLAAVETHHRDDKLSRGISRETLRDRVFRRSTPELFHAVTNALEREGKIVFDHDVFKLATHQAELTGAETNARDALRKIYHASTLEVPKLDEALRAASDESGLDTKSVRKVLQLLVTGGEIVAVTSEFYFSSAALEQLTSLLRESARMSGEAMIDVGRFKDLAGVSRKYAIPLLEYFDRTRVTVRVGDKRQVLS